ncbi:hypothetical protein HGA34_04980 [Candidatus Falkowbacteria bacterium]|nr:hypothetical protein [Candidatus Falkowbacteria bacterium]
MPRKIEVNDLMQSGYSYFLVEEEGKNFDPEFKPQLSPQEMLKLGVFGGKYMTDCGKEFPASWFKEAKLCHERHDASLNFFKVNASQSLRTWRLKGWIHPDDPRGWFQWYCRYYLGRRHEDDLRQIKRWKAITRHWAAVKMHCHKGDYDCRPKQRQALLHWSYDSRSI